MQIISNYEYYEDKEVQLVELPYKKDSMSAIIILPNEKKDINEFISELSDEKLQRLLKRMSSRKVHLELPKFEFEFSSGLNSVLIKLGMKDAFNGNTANFKGIGKDLYFGQVIQKTYLKVDEAGTEAAAITAIIMNEITSLNKRPPKIYSMIVDRPFLFLLKNYKLPINSEMLFMSKIEIL